MAINDELGKIKLGHTYPTQENAEDNENN